MRGSQKFAILLCEFKNSGNVISPPKAFFEKLFLQGTGGVNDYWRSASHGNIDLNGSKVLGWKKIDQTLSDFLAANPERYQKISAAKSIFSEEVSSEYKVVAIYNENVGDGGSTGKGGGVLAGPIDWDSTWLAHEIGHVLGLNDSSDQSTRENSPGVRPGLYYDMHDIMSARNVYSFPDPQFTGSGPLLNAANMDMMGWLDPSRTWTKSNLYSTTYYQFKLVSLGHPEIPGYIAAKFGSLYIEFRTQDGWDRGIPRPCVLIHELNSIHSNSVVIASDLPNYVNDWQPGQFYGSSDAFWNNFGGSRIYIDSFDLHEKTATITVRYKMPRELEDQYILPDWKEFKRPHSLFFETIQELKEELFKTRKELFDTKNEVFEIKKELSNSLFNLHRDILDIKSFGREKR